MEEKIAELVTKLNKHSERLAAGKLPAKWHTPLRIEEDIGKERIKLDELQAGLRKLEVRRIQISTDHGPASRSEGMMGDKEDSDILDVGNLSLGPEPEEDFGE